MSEKLHATRNSGKRSPKNHPRGVNLTVSHLKRGNALKLYEYDAKSKA